MRFSLRVAIWSLRYGLSQLVLLGLAAVATVAAGGLVLAALASLGERIVLPLADRDLGAHLREVAVPVPDEAELLPTSLNLTADRLESIVAAVGVQLAPPDVLDRPRPDPQARDVFAAVSDDLLSICKLEHVLANPAFYPRYQAWRRYHERALDEAIAIILDGEAPVWANDPARDTEGPSTDLAGHLWLHRVLVAEAAISAAAGDDQTAVLSLEASWRLNQALLSSPQLTARLTAIEILELQLAALRRCPLPAGGWPARLAALDPRRDALASYAHAVLRCRHGGEAQRERRTPILGLISRPFARLSMVHHRRAALTAISHLERTSIETFDSGRCAAEVIESVPRWNTLARATLPTSWEWWRQGVHAALAAELTAQVLEVRGLGRSEALARIGNAATRRGSPIAGVAWAYDVDGRGIAIALDPDVFAPDSGFPLRETVTFSSRPPRSG